MTGRFIAYYRVSTEKQGRSGLGLEAQRETVRGFLNRSELAGEFTETESGRSDDRPELAKALARCRVMGATLIVANVSRLTRSVAFLSRLLEAGVEVRFCDLPQIEGPTGRFMLQQMAAVAELEAGLIGDRTRKALAAARARGVKLGRPENLKNTDAGRVNGRAVRTRIAKRRASDLAPVIAELQASGASSLRQIAAGLNARGVRTARSGEWSAVQVARVLERLDLVAPARVAA
ncbi:recombinase family protein [Microvirga sp. 0TCS3.31]